MKSESSIIYVTMEKKHRGQAPTLGLQAVAILAMSH